MKISCVSLKAMLYVSIASFAALIADLGTKRSFSEFTDIDMAIICINFVLQGLIAWRAYLDQSVSRSRQERNQKEKVELLNEYRK